MTNYIVENKEMTPFKEKQASCFLSQSNLLESLLSDEGDK